MTKLLVCGSHSITDADWARYGRGAGHRRNADMVAAANYVLILWDGISSGTKNDIDLCKKNYKNYKLVIR